MPSLIPGQGLGSRIEHRPVWSNYIGPISVQMLGMSKGERISSAMASIVLGYQIDQVVTATILPGDNKAYDIVQVMVGPFLDVGDYDICIEMITNVGTVIGAVVKLPVIRFPAEAAV